MNFMMGQIFKKDSKLFFTDTKIKVKIDDSMYKTLTPYIDRDICFGIRSENIYDKLFVTQAIPENIVKVNCEVVEPMGSEVHLYLNTGKHTFIARVGAQDKPRVNEIIELVFDMSKVHFFDKDTEETII